jgi:hypothetical protein
MQSCESVSEKYAAPILSPKMCKVRKKLYYIHKLKERNVTPKERG